MQPLPSQPFHQQGPQEAVNRKRLHGLVAMAELGISDKVDVVVSGVELSKEKPHPLPYLMTVRALGLEPHNVCAFEDSLPGARSAHAAGLTVFVIGERY